jgi:hypothetical protein
MRTSLLCIQRKDRSLEHVRDSWISRYVLTLSIVFQNLRLVLCIRYWLGEGKGLKEEELGRPHQRGVHVQLDFDSTSDSRTLLHQNWRPGHIRSQIWMFYIWLEPEFLLSPQESLTQVGVQNLTGCCVTVFWVVGPCTVLKPVRVASRGLARP